MMLEQLEKRRRERTSTRGRKIESPVVAFLIFENNKTV